MASPGPPLAWLVLVLRVVEATLMSPPACRASAASAATRVPVRVMSALASSGTHGGVDGFDDLG